MLPLDIAKLFKESICISIANGNMMISDADPVFFDMVDLVHGHHEGAVYTYKLLLGK